MNVLSVLKKIKHFDDFLEATKLDEIVYKKQREAERQAELEKKEKIKTIVITVICIVLGIAAIAGIAYLVYRYLTPDYLEDFDDDFDDDLDDDFFDDEEAIEVKADEE